MQVVLKPGGIFLICLAVLSLGALILYRSRPGDAAPASAVTSISPASAVTSPAPAASIVPAFTSVRSDFEAPFVPCAPVTTGSKAHISGVVAPPWEDNSDWADVSVVYARETAKPHGGAACQKITVSQINNGQAQFNYALLAPMGTSYKAHVYLRADAGGKPVHVEVALRNRNDGSGWLDRKQIVLTGEWHEVTLNGTPTVAPDVYFMVIVPKPGGTVYVDDLEVTKK